MKYLAQKLDMQRGAVALATSIILLVVVTLVVLFAGKVLVQDQRIAGNEYRYNQAMANAEAGLENRNAFILYNGTTGLLYGTSFNHLNTVPYFSASILQNASWMYITSNGYAYGTDQTQGQATVRQGYGYYKLFGKGPDAPLIVAGNVPPVGNMEIVGNPNGGGTGVNVAVWTNQAVNFDPHGSGGTCQAAEYFANGSPTTDSLTGIKSCASNSCSCEGVIDGEISNRVKGVGRDIVTDAATFPSDLFRYVTGFAHADYKTYKGDSNIQKIPPSDCEDLDANSDGIYWVDPDLGSGACRLPGNNVGGAAGNNCNKSASEVCSVVLFVENTELQGTGGDRKFFGVIFSFDRTTTIAANGTISDSNSGDNGGLQMTGNTAVYGVMMSDISLVVHSLGGSFDLVYNRDVINSIVNNKKNQSLARVAGSWIDQ